MQNIKNEVKFCQSASAGHHGNIDDRFDPDNAVEISVPRIVKFAERSLSKEENSLFHKMLNSWKAEEKLMLSIAFIGQRISMDVHDWIVAMSN